MLNLHYGNHFVLGPVLVYFRKEDELNGFFNVELGV